MSPTSSVQPWENHVTFTGENFATEYTDGKDRECEATLHNSTLCSRDFLMVLLCFKGFSWKCDVIFLRDCLSHQKNRLKNVIHIFNHVKRKVECSNLSLDRLKS